jgi:hypothetical protein
VADNLGIQFFLEAKSQYEATGKWRLLVVVLLAYLHFGLVVPFVAATNDRVAVDGQLASSRATLDALKPVLDAADKLAKSIGEAKDRAAADLKAELVGRFQHLSTAVNALAALEPAQAEGAEGEAVFDAARRPQLQQQQQQVVQDDPLALTPMNAKLRGQIAASARTGPAGGLPPGLSDYIETELIKPSFLRANQAWSTSGASIARDGAAAIAEKSAKAKAAVPTAVADLHGLAGSVEALAKEAEQLTFTPPTSPGWWRTVQGKDASIVQMTSNVALRIGRLNTTELSLQTLSTQITDIVRKNQQAEAALNERLAELDKHAAELQSQLGEIGGPLKVISFKLAQIAPLLPLIVAATLAAIALWTADGLQRMALAAELVDNGPDRAVILKWLRAVAGGSRAQIAAAELAVAVVCVAWVLLAARNVAPLPPAFLPQLVLTLIALALIVMARTQRWRSADRAVSG